MFGWNTATIGVTMTVLLEVRNLTKVFSLGPGADLVAVRNASLTVDRGETLGLVGESGSGKTTLGRCILRLIEPTDGSVFLSGNSITALKGKALRDLRSRMQLVFQDPFASLNPRLTVAQTLREPLMLHGFDRAQRKARTAEILRQVGLDESMFDCYPLDLTASEQQRVGIARALVTKPELVVLDEPTSMLDPSARADLLALLQRIQRATGTAYVFISHDLTSVARISHRIAIMYLGHIIEQAPTELIMGRQHHPYSRALLSAVLFADPRRAPSPYVIEGEIPTAINPKTECPLYGRCPIREDACREAIPPMIEIRPEHLSACRRWEHVDAA
jgi:oligopeptide/dipeptide ABC transporter ATP-binding protein